METDYQKFTTKDTPKEKRRKLDVGDIWENKARCLKCKDVIRSKNRHDFVTCSCEAISVDGGSWYARRLGDPKDCEDLTEYYNDI